MNKVLGFAGHHKVMVAFLMVVIAVAIGFAFLVNKYPEGSWRYKMTVTVETPEGIKTGSAVREITVKTGPALTPESHAIVEVKGEAVVVDLGQHGTLFTLLDGDDAYRVVFNVFPFGGGGTTREGVEYYSHLKNAKASLVEKKNIPTMVTFKDIKDPKSVIAVDRANLAGTFGTGVTLKDVTIEMTDEDMTWDVGKYLDWLPEIEARKARLNGSTSIAISTNELSDNLGSGSFRIRR